MKKHELIFSSLKIPLDFIAVWAAFFVARELRLATDLIPGVQLPVQTIASSELHIFAFTGALLYVLLFTSHGLYNIQISGSKIAEVLKIVRYGFYWFLFYSVGVFFGNEFLYSDVDIPRLIILFTMVMAIIFSIIIRFMLNSVQSHMLRNNVLSKRNVLLISSKSKKSITHILEDIEYSGVYKIIGYANPKEVTGFKDKIAHISQLAEIEELCKSRKIDEIIYIDSDFSKQDVYALWEYIKIYGIRYRYVTNNFDVTKTNTSLSLINNTPVIEILNTPLQGWGRISKRTFDIILSLFALIILSPICVIIGFLIKRDDRKGPIIYKNRRIGQDGKFFNCYKFRYMNWNDCIKESYGVELQSDPAYSKEQGLIKSKSERKGALYKIKNDPRKTKIGTFLEKYSLDEIPQFYNVLIGDMSIVGPRPHQPREVQKYLQYQKRVLTIKPGITGMAQVHGREKNNFEKEAKLDIFYIENWSLLLDLKLICKTYPLLFYRK